MGGPKQKREQKQGQRNNCHGRPHCTLEKARKSGFRLKLRIKKLWKRGIWRKPQEGFFYLWLHYDLKRDPSDWLQDCLVSFEKRALPRGNMRKNFSKIVCRLKTLWNLVVLIKIGPQRNLFSYCDSFSKNPKSNFHSNLCLSSKTRLWGFIPLLKEKRSWYFFFLFAIFRLYMTNWSSLNLFYSSCIPNYHFGLWFT